MPRFFVPSVNFSDDGVKICGDDARHIARSLRMAEGDTVTVCDMHGTEHECRLARIRDEECLCEIISSKKGENEPPVKISLFMAYPKADKLEYIVQKAVELGAAEIIPFESERCIKRPAPEKAEKNTARLQRIASEAAKQCGRSVLPTVAAPISYGEALKRGAVADLSIFCYEGDGTNSLKKILEAKPDAKTVSVVVGCEGGFSSKEAKMAEDAGFAMANLGARILRCETAPSFALSSIVYFFEL